MNKTKAHAIFECFKRYNSHPTTELQYQTTFELLIAVMLSAQATDVSVNKVTAKLFPIANTPETLLALGETKLRALIQSIGLYRTKAAHVIKTCQQLITQHHGQVPNAREALEELPGVGRKTANVVLNTAFKQAVMPVDTHVFRVAHRIGFSTGKTPLQVEQDLLRWIAPEFLQDAHHWLILHGRYVCTARRPHCPECIIREWCEYSDKMVV